MIFAHPGSQEALSSWIISRSSDSQYSYSTQGIPISPTSCPFVFTGLVAPKMIKTTRFDCSISSAPTLFLRLLLLALAALPAMTAQTETMFLTSNDPVKVFVASSGATYKVCHAQKAPFNVLSIFNQISIRIDASDNYAFPWHAVKGLSSDDFHSNIETIMYEVFGTDDEKDSRRLSSSEFRQSFFRDIVSACPSPLMSTNRGLCDMSFSPFGEACVQLKTDRTVQVTATAERKFNFGLPLKMICGLILLNLSHPLSKSSLFQVSILSIELFNQRTCCFSIIIQSALDLVRSIVVLVQRKLSLII